MEKFGLLALQEEHKSRILSPCRIDEEFIVDREPFARGKFATVKRVHHKDSQSVYAAKYIRKRRRASPEEVWHEISVLNLSRECPHIVNLFQVFDTPSDTVLLLEMAEGGDLQTYLDAEEFLEESHCIQVLKDTLKGLQFLHSHFIAHLDLKPQNLVISGPLPGGRVKLCDFGLSRKLSNATEIRELFGTAEYLSPEVLSYEPITLSTDCWAVGVLTYVLLSGISPFGGESKQETFLNISQRALTYPSDCFDHVSSSAIDFIEKLLVVNPSDRLSADECLKHSWLETFITSSISHSSSPEEPNNNHKERHKDENDNTPDVDEDHHQSPEECNGTHDKSTDSANISANTDQKGPYDDIDSGIGSEDDHRRNLSWARLDEVLESEQKISSNPDWLTLEIDEEHLGRHIWPNRKKMKSWEAECAGSVLRALDELEKMKDSATPQAKLLRAYGRRGQVIAKEVVGEGQVVIREFRPLSRSPALLTKHSELTCDSISTRINKLFN